MHSTLMFNSWHPNTSMHILHTVLYTFHRMPTVNSVNYRSPWSFCKSPFLNMSSLVRSNKALVRVTHQDLHNQSHGLHSATKIVFHVFTFNRPILSYTITWVTLLSSSFLFLFLLKCNSICSHFPNNLDKGRLQCLCPITCHNFDIYYLIISY